jgi:hypothetical protein
MYTVTNDLCQMLRTHDRAYRRIPKSMYNRVVKAYPNVKLDKLDGHYGDNITFYNEATDTTACIFIAKDPSQTEQEVGKYYSVSYTEDEVKHFNTWLLKTFPPRSKKNTTRQPREYYEDDLVFEII